MRAPLRPSRCERLARRSGIGRPWLAAVAGIVGILADDGLEHRDGVGDGARHRSGDVGEQAQRHDARAAGQPHRRSDADERLVRRRAADRVAGVAAEADRAEVGRDGRGGAAARSRPSRDRARTDCACSPAAAS